VASVREAFRVLAAAEDHGEQNPARLPAGRRFVRDEASGQNLTLESRRSGGDAIDRTSGSGPEVKL